LAFFFIGLPDLVQTSSFRTPLCVCGTMLPPVDLPDSISTRVQAQHSLMCLHASGLLFVVANYRCGDVTSVSLVMHMQAHHFVIFLYSVITHLCFKTVEACRKVRVFIYLVLPDFRKGIAFWEVSSLYTWVLLVRATCTMTMSEEQRFSNFFPVGTTFISQNVLRTTLLLSRLKCKTLVVCNFQTLFEILSYSV
jgi:hypothetical protein